MTRGPANFQAFKLPRGLRDSWPGGRLASAAMAMAMASAFCFTAANPSPCSTPPTRPSSLGLSPLGSRSLRLPRREFTSHSSELRALSDIPSQFAGSLYSLSEEFTDGPIELPPELTDPFAIPETTPLQTAASIVLTGLITVLLFRSIRRRSRRAKENRFRSTGEEKLSVKEDAKKSAIALLQKTPEVKTPPPDAFQTLFGAVVAGGIALVLYKFTVTVEGGFVNKVVSTNYSIRNLTITVRTIVTGLCYLATFVFAANSIGLTLLSLQLALNLGGSNEDSGKGEEGQPTKRKLDDPLDSAPTAEEDRGSE